MYDSYNLIRISDDGEQASVDRLGDMLEGQVAVIESGVLDLAQCADIVDALFSSAMYRPDQQSFLLYPARELPPFLSRNIVPPSQVASNPLLLKLLSDDDSSVIVRDVDGHARFAADLPTRDALVEQLARVGGQDRYRGLVDAYGAATLDIYGEVFEYHSYTGRSGSMYGYEGIGSIYWHMVAKLLVAIQESVLRLGSTDAPAAAIQRLVAGYWRVRGGLGFNKSPREHGAIPIDPYSHTPAHAGAQQPGMTGLVKEEILVRPAELGLTVVEGEIHFDATFIRDAEQLSTATSWNMVTASMERHSIELPEGSAGFTVCQVPVIVTRTFHPEPIEVVMSGGEVVRLDGHSLGRDLSSKVFRRTGEVVCIRASLPLSDDS